MITYQAASLQVRVRCDSLSDVGVGFRSAGEAFRSRTREQAAGALIPHCHTLASRSICQVFDQCELNSAGAVGVLVAVPVLPTEVDLKVRARRDWHSH